jgi:hypothetical protein
MRSFVIGIAIGFTVFGSAGCGPAVADDEPASGSSGSTTTTGGETSTTTGPSECPGEPYVCFFDVEPGDCQGEPIRSQCVDDFWRCPEGTTRDSDCPDPPDTGCIGVFGTCVEGPADACGEESMPETCNYTCPLPGWIHTDECRCFVADKPVCLALSGELCSDISAPARCGDDGWSCSRGSLPFDECPEPTNTSTGGSTGGSSTGSG